MEIHCGAASGATPRGYGPVGCSSRSLAVSLRTVSAEASGVRVISPSFDQVCRRARQRHRTAHHKKNPGSVLAHAVHARVSGRTSKLMTQC
jgi:hypothetical protein